MTRRGRPVSPEEELLFRSAFGDVRPLQKRQPLVHRARPQPRSGFAPLPPYPSEPLLGGRLAPAIGGHADTHLRRGRLNPEARLDLHGMTQSGAYRALLAFLVAAQSERKRLVLVITGKGGVLRAHLPRWLGQTELEPLIAGVREAHARHGGSGAFYVGIRQHKRDRG